MTITQTHILLVIAAAINAAFAVRLLFMAATVLRSAEAEAASAMELAAAARVLAECAKELTSRANALVSRSEDFVASRPSASMTMRTRKIEIDGKIEEVIIPFFVPPGTILQDARSGDLLDSDGRTLEVIRRECHGD